MKKDSTTSHPRPEPNPDDGDEQAAPQPPLADGQPAAAKASAAPGSSVLLAVVQSLAVAFILLTLEALVVSRPLLIGVLIIDLHLLLILGACHMTRALHRRRPNALPRAPEGMVYRIINFDAAPPPGAATVLTGNGDVHFLIATVPTRDLDDGNIIMLECGQQVPSDGVVVQGTAVVDEAVLTDRNPPVLRLLKCRSELFRDTTLIQGRLLMRVVQRRGHPLDWID